VNCHVLHGCVCKIQIRVCSVYCGQFLAQLIVFVGSLCHGSHTVYPEHNVVYHFYNEPVWICLKMQLNGYCPYSFFNCSDNPLNWQYMFISSSYIEVDVHVREEFLYVLKLSISMYMFNLETMSFIYLYYFFDGCGNSCRLKFLMSSVVAKCIDLEIVTTNGISLMYIISTLRVTCPCHSSIPVGSSSNTVFIPCSFSLQGSNTSSKNV